MYRLYLANSGRQLSWGLAVRPACCKDARWGRDVLKDLDRRKEGREERQIKNKENVFHNKKKEKKQDNTLLYYPNIWFTGCTNNSLLKINQRKWAPTIDRFWLFWHNLAHLLMWNSPLKTGNRNNMTRWLMLPDSVTDQSRGLLLGPFHVPPSGSVSSTQRLFYNLKHLSFKSSLRRKTDLI